MIVDPNNAMSFSAFGADAKDDFGGQGARSLLSGDRYIEMERRSSYYECKQHDRKFWDFDGRPINPRSMQPLLGAERSWWVPLKMRRPSAPVRLGRVIVDSFTNLLFGENRFPLIGVEGDENTEDWLQTASRVGKLSQKMIQARAYGGSSGTAGVSWCFRNGKPRFEAHKAQNLFVHTWEDRLELIPAHVTEVYLHSKPKWDGRGFNRIWYWFRRDWTPEADLIFKDVLFEPEKPDILWIVDEEKSNFHNDGVCHLEWIQNLPTDEMDGLPDYEGLYENFDLADLIMSVITRGAVLNLDPTVKLKIDRDEIGVRGLAKGSDNMLVVGKDGDADYMELGGSSIEAGIKLVESMRRFILETAQCVIPDPHEVAAQGVSSVAIKAMFAPMLAKTDVLREQYGTACERILSNMEKSARAKISSPVVLVNEAGVEEPVQFVVDLPPKYDEEPIVDPLTGQPSGEVQTVSNPRQLGPGGEVVLQWPPYFSPTPQDQSMIAQTLTSATGGKAFLSQETATEAAARAFGVDPSEEWKRVQEQGQADMASQAQMIGGDHDAIGGKVSAPHEPPPGGPPAHSPPPAPHEADPDADIPVDVDLTGT